MRKTAFLKLAILILGMVIVLVGVLWLPNIANELAAMDPNYAYLKLPLLTGIYVTAIPYFLALYQSWKLVLYIERECAFSEKSVQSLNRIQKYALSIVLLYAAGMLTLLTQNALHPGIALLGIVIVFATLVILFFAAVLQKLLTSARNFQMENDLTI